MIELLKVRLPLPKPEPASIMFVCVHCGLRSPLERAWIDVDTLAKSCASCARKDCSV